MGFKTFKTAAAVLITFLCVACTTPALFIFPEKDPSPIMKESTPAWLPKGRGDDGYVSVRAEVTSNDAACKTIGSSGSPFFHLYEQKVQIVASMKTSGFKSSLDGQKIPIATFDGRANPGRCFGLNTLPSTAISFARLSGAEADSGVKIIVEIDSTTDVSSNLIPAAQTALGVASVFTTGGAASTVAGLTAWIATPALAQVEKQYSLDLSKIVNTHSLPKLNGWSGIRKGIERVEIPVFMLPAVGPELPKITTTDVGKFPALFNIVLKFQYTKTLFDPSVLGQDDFPSKDSIERQTVLKYPDKKGVPSFMQIIYGEDPNLLKAASITNKRDSLGLSCSKLNGILLNIGLSKIDRAVVVKSFLDEANDGPAWYEPVNARRCFSELVELGETVTKIYGPPTAKSDVSFVIRDIMQLSGPDYERWKSAVPPMLSELRRNLKAQDSRIESLITMNGGKDIQTKFLGFSENLKSEALSAPEGSTKNTFPGIAKLAGRRIDKAGCFVVGDEEDFNPQSYAGHMLLVDERQEIWHLMLKIAPPEDAVSGRFKEINIYSVENDHDWKRQFLRFKYNGGECDELLPLLKSPV